MKTTMKKIVSILLSFVTVMSISSVTAFATETKFNRYEQIRYLMMRKGMILFGNRLLTVSQTNSLNVKKMTTYLLCQ